MYIINSGGWYVGNSAVIEWLSHVNNVSFVHGDLNVFRLEGGIMDMISEKSEDAKKKLIYENKISCIRGCFYAFKHKTFNVWNKGFSSLKNMEHYYKIRYYRKFYAALCLYEERQSESSFDEYSFWRNWLRDITTLFMDESKSNPSYTVLQNPFFYDETFDGHKDIWPDLFSPYKLIFVHRDPFDQLSDLIKTGALNDYSWKRFHGDIGGLNSLERFSVISKKLYNARLRLISTHDRDHVIVVGFEEFIQEHEHVSKRILNFLGLQNHATLWNAKNSLKNIGKGKLDPEVLRMIKGREGYIDDILELRQKLISS